MAFVFFALVIFSFIALKIGKYDYSSAQIMSDASLAFTSPNGEFWFGTDNLGRDYWCQVWYAAQISIKLALIVALGECVLGVTIGCIWGYVRSLDRIMTEIYNVINNIPTIIYMTLAALLFGQSFRNMAIAMITVGWLVMARNVRNLVLMYRDREYNLASRCLGTPVWRILVKNIFPYLISGIAIGFIFKYFYTRGFVFDSILGWFGFELDSLPYWLRDQKINNWSLVATSVWRYFGNNMVLFIGAIMSVDSEMYEAAELDGANKFQQFKHIILPSIKTIITLNVILSITGSLSAFEQPYVITDGANGTGTYFVIMNEIAHVSQKVGLASAMAVVLLLIIFACTILQKLFFKYIFRDAESEDESYKAKRARLKAEKQAKKVGKGVA